MIASRQTRSACRRQSRGRRTRQQERRRQHGLLARRAARARRRTQGRRPLPETPLTRNQQVVAARLAQGQVGFVTLSTWSFLIPFLAFLEEVHFSALLDLPGQGFSRVMIPVARLILTYQLKILLGIGSINLVPTRLFRERALLKLIGYTTVQLQAGCCQRGWLSMGPMHKNTLADAVERLTATELAQLLNATATRLAARGFFDHSPGTFALDASLLETTPYYRGAGKTTRIERKVNRQRQVVEVERVIWGFKVVTLYEVSLRLVVAAVVVPSNVHEATVTEAVVAQAVANLGPGRIRVLVMDMGFLDGQTLWNVKQTWGIDFVIPAKDNMQITTQARSWCRETGDGGWLTRGERPGTLRCRRGRTTPVGQVSVVGVSELRTYTQYGTAAHAKGHHRKSFVGNALSAVVVTSWEGVPYPPGEEKVFLTTLSVADPLAVLEQYGLRSLIENTAFRELKQGWALEHFPKKTEAAVRAHVLLTLVTFTLVNAFRSKTGQVLSKRGMRRWRTEEEGYTVVVFAGDSYAIFDIEEVFILLGVVPATCLRTDPAQVRRKYGLSLAA